MHTNSTAKSRALAAKQARECADHLVGHLALPRPGDSEFSREASLENESCQAVHHRPAGGSHFSSDFGRMVGKSLTDTLYQLSKRLVFALARVGIAIERDGVGPKHDLKIGRVSHGKLDIRPAHAFNGLNRFRASLRGGAHEGLFEL